MNATSYVIANMNELYSWMAQSPESEGTKNCSLLTRYEAPNTHPSHIGYIRTLADISAKRETYPTSTPTALYSFRESHYYLCRISCDSFTRCV